MPIEQYTREEIEQGFNHLEKKLRDIICEVQGEIKSDVQDSIRRATHKDNPENVFDGADVIYPWLMSLSLVVLVLAAKAIFF